MKPRGQETVMETVYLRIILLVFGSQRPLEKLAVMKSCEPPNHQSNN